MIIRPGLTRAVGYIGSIARRPCDGSITTPIDATVTINLNTINCSTGAIVIDSVAVGDGIVQINGAWRLT